MESWYPDKDRYGNIADSIISIIRSNEVTSEKFVAYKARRAGRRAGKSMFSVTTDNFKQVDKAIVDGVTWYSVRMSYLQASWIYNQDKSLWKDHIPQNGISYTIDMHEKLYTMGLIKWS